MNYVLFLFLGRGIQMFQSVVEEAAAIASLALFLGMIAIWARIIATLGQVPEAWG
jgi:phosphate/sulfate permease